MSKYTAAEFVECPLFVNMSTEELQKVVNLMSIEDYTAGETIFSEGDSHAVIWIIIDGRCKVTKKTRDGGQRDLAVLERMRTFGEMSFFHPAPHSATVTSETDVTVARLDRARFHSLVDLGSQAALKIAYNTIAVVSERLRAMDEYVGQIIKSGESPRSGQEWGEFRAKLYSEWQF